MTTSPTPALDAAASLDVTLKLIERRQQVRDLFGARYADHTEAAGATIRKVMAKTGNANPIDVALECGLRAKGHVLLPSIYIAAALDIIEADQTPPPSEGEKT